MAYYKYASFIAIVDATLNSWEPTEGESVTGLSSEQKLNLSTSFRQQEHVEAKTSRNHARHNYWLAYQLW